MKLCDNLARFEDESLEYILPKALIDSLIE
jgi:hypothetical protein